MYTSKYISLIMRKLKASLEQNLDDSVSSTISDLNGTSSDRLVVYRRRTAKNNVDPNRVWTLFFSVDPTNGDLVAYLDAEDNDLLRSAAIKRFKLSVSDESLESAIAGATEFTKKFYDDPNVLYKFIDMVVSDYDDEELDELDAELDKRDSWESATNWSNRKQVELDHTRAKLKQSIEAYTAKKEELMDLKAQLAAADNDEAMLANAKFDEEGQEFDVEYLQSEIARVTGEMVALKRTILLLKDTIEDYEIEKAKYEQSLSKYKLDREKYEEEGNAAKASVMPSATPAELSDEEKAKLSSRARKTLAQIRKMRKADAAFNSLSDEEKASIVANAKEKPQRIRKKKLGDFTDDAAIKTKKAKKSARSSAKKLDLSNI